MFIQSKKVPVQLKYDSVKLGKYQKFAFSKLDNIKFLKY